MPVQEQVASIWAATNGFADDVPVEQMRNFEAQWLEYLRNVQPELLQRIADEKALSDELIGELRSAVESFKRGTSFARQDAAAPAVAAR
jgi:F-type H+-transporting ATPase subunit alpha